MNKFLIASKADAVTAFARGENLTKRERNIILTRHFGDSLISPGMAILIAIKYSRGRIPEWEKNLHKLTVAWLCLGEKAWQKIVSTAMWVINFSASVEVRALLRRFYIKFQALIVKCKPNWAL